jgi:NTP pyrophosphatase (non-canonical NTP hydrolase)
MEQTLRKAIDKYGEIRQIEKLEEECLELALAIRQWRNKGGLNSEAYAKIVDEIADVDIMLTQAKIIFPIDLIDERKEFKIKRLKSLI